MRKRCSEEDRKRALEELRTMSARDVAAKYGTSYNTVLNWARRAKAGNASGARSEEPPEPSRRDRASGLAGDIEALLPILAKAIEGLKRIREVI